MAKPHTWNKPGEDTESCLKMDTTWKAKVWTTKEHNL